MAIVSGNTPHLEAVSPLSDQDLQLGLDSGAVQNASRGLAEVVDCHMLDSVVASRHGYVEPESPIGFVECRESLSLDSLSVDGHPGASCPPAPSWASIVVGTAKHPQSMPLRYIEPSLTDGNIVISPPISVLEQGAKRWECYLVGFILDNRLPPPVVKSIVMKMWAKKGLLDVLAQGVGFFFFRFSNAEGLSEVLQGGPWLIAGRHVFLR